MSAPGPKEPLPLKSVSIPAGESPFSDLMGLTTLEVGHGRGRLELEVKKIHLRNRGIIHGGVVATLMDSVLGTAVLSLAPPDHFTVTMQLNINFIRTVREGEKLVATSEVAHAGRQTAVARGEIHNGRGAVVATGSATFFFLPSEARK